jgi:hypothetical protein
MAVDDNPSHDLGTGMGEARYDPVYRDAGGILHPYLTYPVNVAFTDSAIDEVKKADPESIQQVAASQLALSNSYYANVLMQAQRSFIAAIASAAIGLAFFVTAVLILVLRNDIRAGTVSAISGGIVEVISGLNFWLYGRTAIQLNSFHIRLDQIQKYLIANSIATKLDGGAQETALVNLISQIAGQHTSGRSLKKGSD